MSPAYRQPHFARLQPGSVKSASNVKIGCCCCCIYVGADLQAEIRGVLKLYGEAAEKLAWAAQRDPSFAKTAEYKSLNKQLLAVMQ